MNEAQVNGLALDTRYYFAVSAVNAEGAESELSAVVSGVISTTAPPPPSPVPPAAYPGSYAVIAGSSVPIVLTGYDPDGRPLAYSIATPPRLGTLSGTPPNLTYRVGAGLGGLDSFSFTVNNGISTSTASTVLLAVIPGGSSSSTTSGNSAPVATAGSLTVAEDGSAAVVLKATDANGDPLTYTVSAYPSKGTLSGTAPNLTYRPNANYTGSDSFTFTAADGYATSAPATVTITVSPVNDAPVAAAASATVPEDGSIAIGLTGTDVDGDALTYTIVSGPAHGTLTGTAPSVTYKPAANYTGTDSFTFTVKDAVATSAAATVSITVTAVNDAPVAVPATLSVTQNGLAACVVTGTDVEGDALTFAVVSPPTNGVLSGVAPNLTYRPNTNFVGSDSFTFTARDGSLTSAPATISISVTPVNYPPTATSMAVTVNEDTVLPIVLAGSDPNGDPLTYTVTVAPTKGTLSGTAPNLTYRPNANANGLDSFAFTVKDATLTSSPATVAIAVVAINDAPVASPVSVSVVEDGTASIVLAGSDVDGDALTYVVTSSPSHGSLTGTAPNLTYRPAANYFGTDAFTYVVRDAALSSTAAIVTITVTPVNDVPVAAAKSLVVPEDGAGSVVLSATDVEGSPLTFAVAQPPTKGTLSGTPPNLTYRPNANFSGTDSFTYTANDGTATSAPATVSVTVTTVNDAPVGSVLAVAVIEDTPTPFSLTGTDSDGDTLTYAVVNGPAHGTLSGTAPSLVYTPSTNYYGPDAMTFTVSDALSTSAPVTVSFSVSPVNDAPVGTSSSYTLPQTEPLPIRLPGVDVDGDVLTYVIQTGPFHGTLSGTPPDLIYTPNEGYQGPDYFTYIVRDSVTSSSPNTITIEVTRVNIAPVATPLTVTVAEDGFATVVLAGSDGNGDALSYSVLTAPAKGSLSGTAPNLTYRPNANYSGADVFTYVVRDGSMTSTPASVNITVSPVNDAPKASPAVVTVAEDGTATLLLTGTDADGDALTYAIVTGPSHGTLTGTAPNVTYRPSANYNGSDSFTFTVRDGSVTSAAAAVSITVTPVNDAPVAIPGSLTVAEDGDVNAVLVGADADGDALTFAIVSGPSNGTLSGTPPNVTYRPNANYSGSDAFSFTVRDGSVTSAAATISISILPVNDAPVAVPASLTVAEDSAVSIVLAGSDVEGSALTYVVVDGPNNGTLSGTPPDVTYRPNPNYYGPDSFSFTVSDGSATSGAATVDITVTPVNDRPVANPLSIAVAQGGSASLILSGSDADGDALSYSLTTSPTRGTLSGTPPNLVYQPNAGYSGSDSFTYVVSDRVTASEPATVSIVVSGANQAPTATPITVTVAEDGAVSFVLKGTDPEGASLKYALATSPIRGTLSGTLPNLTYRPKTNFFGADSLSFTVSDGSLTSSPAPVSITVTPVNDVPVANSSWVSVPENGTVSIALSASDADGDALSYVVLSGPSKGTLTGSAPNLKYTPNQYFAGMDSFTWVARDGVSTSAAASFTIIVTQVNYPPVATSTSVSVAAGGSLPIVLQGSDPDGDPITYTLASNPVNGTLSGVLPNLTYKPNAGFTGTDCFTFTVKDYLGVVSSPGKVVVNVSSAALASRAVIVSPAGTASILSDGTASVVVSGPEGGAAVVLRRSPRHGSVDLRPDGTFEYRHDGSDSLEDSFTYAAEGSAADAPETEVRVEVLRLVDLRTRADHSVSAEFTVVGGLHYRVESSLEPADVGGDWRSMADFVAESSGNATVVLRDVLPAPARYFRVVCEGSSRQWISDTWVLKQPSADANLE